MSGNGSDRFRIQQSINSAQTVSLCWLAQWGTTSGGRSLKVAEVTTGSDPQQEPDTVAEETTRGIATPVRISVESSSSGETWNRRRTVSWGGTGWVHGFTLPSMPTALDSKRRASSFAVAVMTLRETAWAGYKTQREESTVERFRLRVQRGSRGQRGVLKFVSGRGSSPVLGEEGCACRESGDYSLKSMTCFT